MGVLRHIAETALKTSSERASQRNKKVYVCCNPYRKKSNLYVKL